MEREFEHRITEVEDRSKSNTKRIDKLEERQDNLDELASAVKVLAVREANVESDVKEMKKDVKTLTEKPARRWEALIGQIISLLVAAAFGFFVAKLSQLL